MDPDADFATPIDLRDEGSHPLRWKRALGLAVALVVVGALVAFVTSSGPEDQTRPAAGFAAVMSAELQGFDGEAFTLDRYRGRPLVVNFFASWCGPCAREMPAFAAVHEALADEVAFVGVNLQDNPRAALDLVERTGVTYDLGRDDGRLFQALGGVAMPTTAFITAAGVVAGVHGGELSAQALEDSVRRLLLAS